jgi:hypothetical protein
MISAVARLWSGDERIEDRNRSKMRSYASSAEEEDQHWNSSSRTTERRIPEWPQQDQRDLKSEQRNLGSAERAETRLSEERPEGRSVVSVADRPKSQQSAAAAR